MSTKLGVIAITEIPTGARSAPFPLSSISAKVSVQQVPVQIGIWQNGEISPLASGTASVFWPKLITIAPDCHVQNVRICRWQGDTVVLQATRLILTGQPLYLWFGEDLLVNDLEIPPYLSPSNIRGGNSYICNKCSEEFEAPNFLKMHLASNCGSVSMDILWTRLARVKNQPSLLSLNFLSAMTSSFPGLSGLTSVRSTPPCFVSPSVVLPANVVVSSSDAISFDVVHQRQCNNNSHHIPPNRHNNNNNNNNKDEQAHLESIVSNMGKAKNGHVCLYCGKLYSRKYGLKIHIRTHTGYKPLKCRICHRPFGDPSNLNKHVRLHSEGNTPSRYRCEFCSKILVRRRDLDRHIRSRHGNLDVNETDMTANEDALNSRLNHFTNATITSTSSSSINTN